MTNAIFKSYPRKIFNKKTKPYSLIMSEGLMYECIKASATRRASLLSKFPSDNMYHIIPSIAKLIQFEKINKTSCAQPSAHIRTNTDKSKHSLYADKTYNLSPELISVLSNQANTIIADAEIYKKISSSIFDTTIDATSKIKQRTDKLAYLEQLENDILYNIETTLKITRKIKEIPQELDPSWITFKYFQSLQLFSLHLYEKLKTINQLKSNNSTKYIQHDIPDIQYLTLGCQQNGLTTKESKLIRWFNKLNPNGVLLCD